MPQLYKGGAGGGAADISFSNSASSTPYTFDTLVTGMIWEGKGSQVPRPTMASGGIFFFNLDDHLGIGTNNCWAFPALEKEIYLVLLNKKDGDRCWFLGIGTPCIYWRGYIYNEQKNTVPSKLYELISFLVYLRP